MLRRLSVDDWQAFRDARLTALAESPGNFFRALTEEEKQPEPFWRDRLTGDDRAIFGAFADDRLIGITGVFTSRTDPDCAEFGMTWVAPDWRGRGLAALYYRERIAWARSHGFVRIVVSHRRSNIASRRAMIGAGFREVAAVPHCWPDGVEDDDIRYELRLA